MCFFFKNSLIKKVGFGKKKGCDDMTKNEMYFVILVLLIIVILLIIK